jgi:type II secretory pathway component PulM
VRVRRRSALARYNEVNPTTETYVLAGIGAVLFVGLAYWLLSQTEENEASMNASSAQPSLVPASTEQGSNVQTLGPGGSSTPLPTQGAPVQGPSVAGAPIQSPYYPPVGGVTPGADQLINSLPSI